MANQENYDDFCKKLHLTIKLTEADLELSAGIPSIPAEKVFAQLKELIYKKAHKNQTL